MKMFLTRMGVGSKVVVTGDVTQIDLPDVPAAALWMRCTFSRTWMALHSAFYGEGCCPPSSGAGDHQGLRSGCAPGQALKPTRKAAIAA